jgi:ribosomal protein L12E/L44/L45/RPP1/RPP2
VASIGSLVVDLRANTGSFETDLGRAAKAATKRSKEINDSFSRIGNQLSVLGLAAAAGLAAMAKAAIDNADNLRDMSQASGISVEALSQLQYAAKLSGTSLEDIAAGFRKLSSSAADAAAGVKGPADAFKQLGISATEADGSLKGTEELLLDIATVFSQYEDGAGKAAIAQDLFGKSGAALIPFLNQGRDGIEELKNEADKLGITISQKTADAADRFNDNLQRLKAGATGLGNEIAAQLLPMLENLSSQFAESASSGTAFSNASTVIAIVLKILVSGGLVVSEVFDRLGSAIGAAAAALVAVAQGQFKQAFNIIKESNADTVASVQETAAQLSAVWSASGANIVATAKATDEVLKKSFAFGGGGSPVQEVTITAQKIETAPMEKFFEDLQKATQSSSEQAIEAYNAQKEALNLLYDEGRISLETYNERLGEALDDLLPEVEVTAKKITDLGKKSVESFGEQFKDAAFDTLTDGIYFAMTDGSKKGWKGFLEAGLETINRLVAAALAKKLAEGLFGTASAIGGTTGGLISSIAGFFGGGRAYGGDVTGGTMYRVNEREGEFFRPNVSGKVIPLSKMAGGSGGNTFAPVFNVRGDISRRTAQQLAVDTSRRQRLTSARLG